MLRKMLVVGVGGSGGATVRVLRDELRHRLDVLGWKGDLPSGWQFLHIDTPDSPDGNDSDLPDQLPAHLYVGLSQRGLDYAEIDDIVSSDPDLLKSISGWRPEPASVDVPVHTGAGQYRAVGRMLVYQSMDKIKVALEHRLNEMTSPEADLQLDEVSALFAAGGGKQSERPMLILASSLAGGSGSGAFLDVLDAMRHVIPDEWAEDILAVLYAPDVFRALKKEGSVGVQGNVLAATSELIAATLNKNTGGGAHEFTLLNRVGLDRKISQRGARAFLIGRGNGLINFSDQNQVFHSVGRALASWATSQKVQGQLISFVVSNWGNTSTQPDATGLAPNVNILRSFGSATIGLGRDRFARYAADRLAGRALHTLLDGHQGAAVLDERAVPDEVQVRAKADAEVLRFKLETGLMELGQEYGQIQDSLIGSESFMKLFQKMAKLVAADFRKDRSQMSPPKAASDLAYLVEQRLPSLRADRQKLLEERSEKWVRDIQERVLGATAALASTAGLRVARDVIDHVITELENEVVPEFRQMEGLYRKGRPKESVQGVLSAQLGALEQSFDVSSAPVEKWLGQALKGELSDSWEGGAARAQLLVSDLCSGFLRPLRGILQRAYDDLLVAREGSAERPSPAKRWLDAARDPSKGLLPPDNMLLLEFETPDEYDAAYRRLLLESIGGDDWIGAERKAVRAILLGAAESEQQRLLVFDQRWSPTGEIALSAGSGQAAQFRAVVGLTDLHHRAEEWVRSPEMEFGKYVRESLKSYLRAEGLPSEEQERRLIRFRDRFRRGLEISSPLVDIDEAMMQKIHSVKDAVSGLRPIISSLPFAGSSHPARRYVEEVLKERASLDPAEISNLFDESEAQEIEITTFLGSAYNPFVYASLVSPIAGQVASFGAAGSNPAFWDKRRTRQLPYAVPLAPEYREAIVKGWWLARVMGDIRGLDDVVAGKGPVSLRIGDRWISFPFPLLGPSPWRREEVLPAVLESLPLALVMSTSKKDLSPLEPYQRLLALGAPRAAGMGPAALHSDVEAWVETGRGGASDVPDEIANLASPDDRRRGVANYFTEMISHFAGFFEDYGPRRETAATSRAWELQQDIRKAFSDLATLFSQDHQVGKGKG